MDEFGAIGEVSIQISVLEDPVIEVHVVEVHIIEVHIIEVHVVKVPDVDVPIRFSLLLSIHLLDLK